MFTAGWKTHLWQDRHENSSLAAYTKMFPFWEIPCDKNVFLALGIHISNQKDTSVKDKTDL